MQFPFDDLALENQLLTLQNVMLRSGGKPRHIMLLEEQSVQDFGLTLFNTLFTGAIGKCYAVSRREYVEVLSIMMFLLWRNRFVAGESDALCFNEMR